MPIVRTLMARRQFAALLLVATLLLKMLVPAGYMVSSVNGHPAIIACTGVVEQVASSIAPDVRAGMHDHGKSKGHARAEMPCAFSALSAPALGTIDPILLIGLVAFIMVVGLRPATGLKSSRPAFLRPPLRGPPVTL